MRVRLKVDPQWFELEQRIMLKMKKDYEDWARETLKKAKEALDLRTLREVFYQLGDRWEWDQATGDWLSTGEPLDAIGLILRLPGLKPNKERFIVYAVMAYSKGLTDQFDHLGDKERIIFERDLDTGKMVCWSTTGHGAMDLYPTDLSQFNSLEEALENSHLVAQPGDHALRIEVPRSKRFNLISRLWQIALGSDTYTSKEILLLTSSDIEDVLDFKFARYAQAVIDLDLKWREATGGTVEKAKEKVLDRIPDHIESKDKQTLRRIEGLLYELWFMPPTTQIEPIRFIYDELNTEPTPTKLQSELTPLLGELIYSLQDVLDKGQYLKWKSVIDQKSFSDSDVFQGMDISNVAKEAFAVALDDILREHSLAYVGYPERSTFVGKALRVILGTFVLPLRIIVRAFENVKVSIGRKLSRNKETESVEDQSPPNDETSPTKDD